MREQFHNLDMPTGPKGNEGDWKIAHTQKETQCSQKLKKKKKSFYCTVLEWKDNAKSQSCMGTTSWRFNSTKVVKKGVTMQ